MKCNPHADATADAFVFCMNFNAPPLLRKKKKHILRAANACPIAENF